MPDKWQDASHQILSALDIRAEYVRLGARLAAKDPSASGWLPVHALGREDRTASAAIYVGDGPFRGRYCDHGGGGLTLSLFDAAAQFGPFSDWKEARLAYAKQTNVELPSGDESARAMDRLELFDLTPVSKLQWSRRKQGVSPQSLDQVGARGARWPRGRAAEYQEILLAVPMFGHGLLDLDPVAYHSAPLAGKHIRQYQGPGNEDKLIRVMTLGSPGIMNAWALRHMAEAEVVWLVEGLSDMLALQSALGDRTDHVVVSFGGASYHVSPELQPMFAGKDVRICYDNDDAGRNGAKVQVGKLVDVASVVRNIVLPKGTKDTRDFLNAGNDYAALWRFSETFDAIAPADESEQLQPHQALLATLGIVVMGQVDGTDHVEIYSRSLHKTTTIRDLNRLTLVTATLAIGDIVAEHVEDEKNPGPGKKSILDLKMAIATEGGSRLLSSQPAVGCGVWPVGDSIVLVGPRQADIYTPSGELEPIDSPVVDDQRLHFNGEPWYERGELKRYLQAADDDGWCQETFSAARDLFARWSNWKSETAPELIAALVAASWVQTLWPFRPLIGILGGTNCGKSMLLELTLPHIFGGLTLALEKPTEAGMRQLVGDSAKILVLDEFEKCDHRTKILELLRTSARGGKIARGSSGGSGKIYGLKHIVWTGAIEINLSRQADANRFLLFHLGPPPPGPPALHKPTPAEENRLRDLGQRLLAFVLRRFSSIRRRAEAIKRLPMEADNRAIELYSVPLSIIAEANGMGDEEQASYAKVVIGYQQADVEIESDEADLVTTILESQIILPRGVKTTVSALLRGTIGIIEGDGGQITSTDEVLATVGLRVLRQDGDRSDVELFVGVKPARQHLLGRTKYRESDIGLLLARVDGSRRARKIVGGHKPSGVAISFSSLHDLVGFEEASSDF